MDFDDVAPGIGPAAVEIGEAVHLREAQPGVYVGSYTVRRHDNPHAFARAVATLQEGHRHSTAQVVVRNDDEGRDHDRHARRELPLEVTNHADNAVVDPKDFAANSFVDRKADVCVIPPNSFVLARTVEYFRIPRDVLVICLGKSTYARCGIIVNVTPLEPEWEGHVTLEFSNTTPLPAKIYANEGACQFLFLKGNEPCQTSYADRAGKYMGQRGVTLPKL